MGKKYEFGVTKGFDRVNVAPHPGVVQNVARGGIYGGVNIHSEKHGLIFQVDIVYGQKLVRHAANLLESLNSIPPIISFVH